MTKAADSILDGALAVLENATHLHLCSSEPANFAAVAALVLATKESPVISAPADGSPSGRKADVEGFDDGEVVASGTASHWVLVDDVGEELLLAKTLSSSRAVVENDAFEMDTFAALTLLDAS